jgi:acyl-coenzyme A synthetase/AMP-(fatty) acid ligase
MYGLEWALMLPTAAPVRLYCGADFYPQDVAAALRGSDHAAILISTPLHLRALSKADLPAGALEFIVSATAPIEAELVTNLEENLGARVFEVYGCSEIGSLAWRLPRETPGWEFFDCFDLRLDGDEITVDHNDLEQPVVLADRFAPCPAGGYTLEGRATDIVKVAGKRESLARLNALLTAIEGVDDGVFYRPEDFGFPARDRLAAVVVAPALSSQQVRAALALRLESTFMPRPLDVVADLPRETTSKLNHETLGALLRKLRA